MLGDCVFCVLHVYLLHLIWILFFSCHSSVNLHEDRMWSYCYRTIIAETTADVVHFRYRRERKDVELYVCTRYSLSQKTGHFRLCFIITLANVNRFTKKGFCQKDSWGNVLYTLIKIPTSLAMCCYITNQNQITFVFENTHRLNDKLIK